MARLELVWRERAVGTMQTPRRFLDFVVDGESLHERVRRDVISCLGWLPPREDELAAARLLREAPPDLEDRVAVYICPECGDLDCGAVTALISRDGDAIVWSDIAYSWPDFVESRLEHEPIRGLDSVHFEPRAYREAITNRPRA